MKRLRFTFFLGAVIMLLSGCRSLEDTAIESKQAPVIITILAGQSTSDAGVEDMISERVAEILPEVKLEWECVDWGESFDARIRARFAAGDVPDLMIGKAQDVKTYYSTGNLERLNPSLVSGIMDEALEPVTIDGNYYGIPFNAWYQGVIYHKKIF